MPLQTVRGTWGSPCCCWCLVVLAGSARSDSPAAESGWPWAYAGGARFAPSVPAASGGVVFSSLNGAGGGAAGARPVRALKFVFAAGVPAARRGASLRFDPRFCRPPNCDLFRGLSRPCSIKPGGDAESAFTLWPAFSRSLGIHRLWRPRRPPPAMCGAGN